MDLPSQLAGGKEDERNEENAKYNDLKDQVETSIREDWEREQSLLRAKLITEDTEPWQLSGEETGHSPEGLKYIGGVDLSFVKGDSVNACASLVILNFPEHEVVYEDCQMVALTAPYIPGFLAFREAGFLVDCVNRLLASQPKLKPQVILVDGNGLLHPRQFGLACHLGVLLGIATVGVAKKLFQVEGLEKNQDFAEKIADLKKGGDSFPLVGNSGRVLGITLKSCDSTTNPIYVSVGHMISLETATWVVQQCCRYRIPEPVRQADIRSREYLRQRFPPEPEMAQNKEKRSPKKTRSKRQADDHLEEETDTDAENKTSGWWCAIL